MAKSKAKRQEMKRLVGEDGTGGRRPSTRLSFRVDSRTFEAARRKADEERISISELTRKAVRRYVGV